MESTRTSSTARSAAASRGPGRVAEADAWSRSASSSGLSSEPARVFHSGARVASRGEALRNADRTEGEGGHRMPGGQSRWRQGKDLSREPLRPEMVCEAAYEHMQGNCFRHMSHFRRWRTDKRPEDCTYAQLEVVPPQELAEVFESGR
jgi:hypothetical protein